MDFKRQRRQPKQPQGKSLSLGAKRLPGYESRLAKGQVTQRRSTRALAIWSQLTPLEHRFSLHLRAVRLQGPRDTKETLADYAPGDNLALTGARADIVRFKEQLEVRQCAVRSPYLI